MAGIANSNAAPAAAPPAIAPVLDAPEGMELTQLVYLKYNRDHVSVFHLYISQTGV